MDRRDIPEPEIFAVPAPTPVTRGWWEDPFDVLPKITTQRFHDGVSWTSYIVYLRGRLWSPVEEFPVPNDIAPE